MATITIAVKNIGNGKCDPGKSHGTIVQDNQPAGLVFGQPVSISQSGGTAAWQCGYAAASNNLTCATSGSVPSGYSATFTFQAKVTANAGSSISNCATVSNAHDTNAANNKSCVTAKVKGIPPDAYSP